MALLRSYLFAPGHDEKLLGKVFAAGADAVVLDLEDSVPAAEKSRARDLVRRVLQDRVPGEWPAALVRINGVDTREWREDVSAVAVAALAGLRVPKAESADQIRRVDEALSRAEAASGLPRGTIVVAPTVETAQGVLAARELAGAPRVVHLTFGAADFAGDVRADPGPDEVETLYARSHLVTVSRAASIDPPVASVYVRLHDEEGLRRSTEAARRLGFFGRSVIHPRQISVVHGVFTPSAEEVRHAQELLEALGGGAATGTTADGQFVDAAIVRRARAILELARTFPPS